MQTAVLDKDAIMRLEELINQQQLDCGGLADFCDSVKDLSLVHRNPDEAKKLGFTAIPIVGTWLSALGERAARNVISMLNSQNGINLMLAGNHIKFHSPIYLGEKSSCKITAVAANSEGHDIKIGFYADAHEEPAVEARYMARHQAPEGKSLGRELFRAHLSLTLGDITEFMYRTGQDRPHEHYGISTHAHGEALGVAGLLQFLTALNTKFNTEYDGKNMSMKSTFSGLPSEGIVEVAIYEGRPECSQRSFPGGACYSLITRVTQPRKDHKSLLAQSRIECATNGQLNIYAFTPEQQSPRDNGTS